MELQVEFEEQEEKEMLMCGPGVRHHFSRVAVSLSLRFLVSKAKREITAIIILLINS